MSFGDDSQLMLCEGCGDAESDLYGPIPGTEDQYLCMTCAEKWGAPANTYQPLVVELLTGLDQGGSVRGSIVELGIPIPTLCDHTHVEALARWVQSWN